MEQMVFERMANVRHPKGPSKSWQDRMVGWHVLLAGSLSKQSDGLW